MAEDDALLFSEGVPDIPSLEDLRKMERRCSSPPDLHIVDNLVDITDHHKERARRGY